MRTSVYLAAFVGLLSASRMAGAAALLAWDFGSDNGSAVSAASTSNDPGVAPATLTRGAGFTPDSVYVDAGRGAFNTNWDQKTADLSEAQSKNSYVQFALAINPGSTANVSSLEGYVYSQNRARTWTVLYSSDAFATEGLPAGSFDDPENFSGQAFSLDTSGVSGLQGVSGTLTFRIYMIDGPSGGGAYEMRGFGQKAGDSTDLAVNGTVSSAVPEAGAMGVLAPLGLTMLRRRR
jgi:hypothetical protein